MLKEVKIELTNKCSRNCKHCSSSATSDNKNLKSLDYNDEEELSTYSKEEFFDEVFKGQTATLGFHYAVSKDSISKLNEVINQTIEIFDKKTLF